MNLRTLSRSHWLRSNLTWLGIVASVASSYGGIPAAIVNVQGVSALQVPLETQGGMLLPVPQAVLNLERGAVAVAVKVKEFPSNATLLDFGNENTNHIVISESYDGKSSEHGHFRLVVFDNHGVRRTVEGPQLDVGQTYLLAFAYHGEEFTFWINGKNVGTLKGVLTVLPDQLALIEPIGLKWERVAIWSQERSEAQLQGLIGNSQWTLDPQTTFLAIREDPAGVEQNGWVGPGLMTPAATLQLLQKPAVGRELFVDTSRGREDGDGSEAKPFQRIQQAADMVGPGDTVTVMPGVYRESVTLRHSGSKDAPIVFRAAPEGVVTIEGADSFSGFTAAGKIDGSSLWVKSGFQSRDVPFGNARLREALSKQRPAAMMQLERRGRLDTLWCDGRLLSKADSREELGPNKFWVDKEKRELILALNPEDRPENHRFEIGMRGPLIAGSVSYIQLKGFCLRHDDSNVYMGAITLSLACSHWLIENINESDGNWSGIRLGGWDHVLRHNVWEHNGDEGFNGSLLQYILLDGDVFRFNNWQRGINPSFEGGAGKFTQSDHVTIRNCEAAFNLGAGFWFDCNNSNMLLENNRSYYNGSGMEIEISPGPFTARNNVFFANTEAGIASCESANGLIENNTVVGNKYGIQLRNIPGRGPDSGGAGFGIVSPGVTWKTARITIQRNVIAENTVAGIISSDGPLDIARDQVTSDANLFFQNGAMIVWPLPGEATAKIQMDAANDWLPPANKGGQAKLLSLDAIHKALGLERQSIAVDPLFRFPDTYEWDYDTNGPAASLQAGHEFLMTTP
jgi:parallel beta helix pectate lyase-like protein